MIVLRAGVPSKLKPVDAGLMLHGPDGPLPPAPEDLGLLLGEGVLGTPLEVVSCCLVG